MSYLIKRELSTCFTAHLLGCGPLMPLFALMVMETRELIGYTLTFLAFLDFIFPSSYLLYQIACLFNFLFLTLRLFFISLYKTEKGEKSVSLTLGLMCSHLCVVVLPTTQFRAFYL